jgi:glutathione S-transferase
MDIVRKGREVLKPILTKLGEAAEMNGYLASREVSLGDLAVAAHLSALDYFGEVPWADFPAIAEWYMRMKSRPSFRSLLNDRVPGQPPVSHYSDPDA